jgi:hypothetical protein
MSEEKEEEGRMMEYSLYLLIPGPAPLVGGLFADVPGAVAVVPLTAMPVRHGNLLVGRSARRPEGVPSCHMKALPRHLELWEPMVSLVFPDTAAWEREEVRLCAIGPSVSAVDSFHLDGVRGGDSPPVGVVAGALSLARHYGGSGLYEVVLAVPWREGVVPTVWSPVLIPAGGPLVAKSGPFRNSPAVVALSPYATQHDLGVTPVVRHFREVLWVGIDPRPSLFYDGNPGPRVCLEERLPEMMTLHGALPALWEDPDAVPEGLRAALGQVLARNPAPSDTSPRARAPSGDGGEFIN